MEEVSLWESAAGNIILPVLFLFIFVIVLNVYDKYARESHLTLSDKQHTWQPVIDFNKSYRCSGCEVLLVKDGVVCDTCGLSADAACFKKVSVNFKCKEVSLDARQLFKHRWIEGNFPVEIGCEVCSKDNLNDWKWKRCIWCHKTVHLRCQLFLGEICDFGKFRHVIIPPTHVQIIKRKSRIRGSFKLRSISDPSIIGWTPVFVIANRSSGSQAADEILSRFRSILHPLQTCELTTHTLKRLVFILTLLPQSCKPIILVAGGDGTVASILTLLHKNRKHIKCDFRIGIVPLGTGNDLSRVLGWGREEPQPFSAHKMLSKLLAATPIAMDRWEVSIIRGRRLGLSQQTHEVFMYNYISFGVDARVTLDFHKARNSSLYFGGRLINKALYFLFGTQQVVDRECIGLEKNIELELDGLAVKLPPLEGVVILNIASWGAGCRLWELKEPDEHISEQSMTDGRFEVVGIYSSFHMAQLQVGLSTPYRIGQASKIKIVVKTNVPMQMDGEPWMQSPGIVHVKFGGKVSVLKAPLGIEEETGDELMNKEL